MKFKSIFGFLNRKQPIIQPVTVPYVRTEDLRKELLKWEIEHGWKDFATALGFANGKNKNSIGDTYYQYRDKAANGILIPTPILENIQLNMRLVMEGMVDRILDLDYYRNHAYERREIMPSGLEKNTIFQYLKPNFDMNNLESIPQQFGNIIIEFVELNKQFHSMKLMTQIYSGRPYLPARTFDDLMNELGL